MAVHEEVLQHPYTKDEIRRMVEDSGDTFIEGVIELDLSDAIDRDEAEFNEFLSEALTGNSDALADVSWEVADAEGGLIHLRVMGDVGVWLEEEADSYDEEEEE